MTIDARRAYDTWLLLISDEEIYRHVIAGTHRQLRRDLAEDQLCVLDRFHAEPGTRWNIENLRFRTALEVGDTLASYLPRTVRLLTKGDDDWRQEICFEYLAFHRWHAYGQHRFAECERFGTYMRERIMKRRFLPPHLVPVLDFELAVVRVLKRTAEIRPEDWPKPPEGDVGELVLRRAHCVEICELPVDIREWVSSADPLVGSVRDTPVTFLVYVPSLTDTHRIKILGEGTKAVLDRFCGQRTTAQLAHELEEELGIDPPELLALAEAWLTERILVADRSHG